MANEKAAVTTTNAVKKEDVKKLSFFKKVAKWWLYVLFLCFYLLYL